LSAEASMPFILYNVPGRTGLNALPETIAMIANEVPDVVGVKEATANLGQVSDVIEQCPEGFIVLSGDDFTVLPLLALGGHGELHFKMQPLNRVMFVETNPIPVKTALGMMGKFETSFRLPLVPLMEESKAKLEAQLKASGLL
ncbi:4-hydroxy-tetrahydrodipicolinate synthase, partial [Aduncisulcus paluster]